MSYPTMCCEVESTKTCDAQVQVAEKSLRGEVSATEKELFETRCILTDIVTKIINSSVPDDKVPEPKCLDDEVQIVNLLATHCRGLAVRINELLFG